MIVLQKKQFQKLNSLVETLESILVEAHKTKGWQWVCEEPLWVTWSLEKFGASYCTLWNIKWHSPGSVTTMADIVIPYRRSLDSHIKIVSLLRNHSTPFEQSREAINQWVMQPVLQEDGWAARWEDVCNAEVERWEKA